MKPSADLERVHDLLADRAVLGLDAAQERELEELLARHAVADADAYDLSAAALHLALLPSPPPPLPARLRQRLLGEADAFLAGRESALGAEPSAGDDGDAPGSRAPGRLLALTGWVAAAAAIALVLLARDPDPRALDPAELRARLLEVGEDAVAVEWEPTRDPRASGVSGDVVWSGSRQEGYLRFSGLEPNDPRSRQYQLWIFDASRTEEHPVDGGVFDVGPGREVVVPIRAKLPVAEAELFAVTLEPPGGVVVSDRERLLLLARR